MVGHVADVAARHRQVAADLQQVAAAVTDWNVPSPVDGWTAVDVVRAFIGRDPCWALPT